MKSEQTVTILLFSKDRPRYLTRALSYLGSVPYAVLVSDGSDEMLCDKHDCNDNITYLHRPEISLVDRLNELSELAQTEYVLLATDDDFFDLSCIELSVNFLNEHPSYSCSQGLYIRFGDYIDPARRSVKWFWDYVYSRHFNFFEENPKERISKALEHPVMHYCYSVMRKQHFQNSLGLVRGVDLSCPSIFELSFLIVLMASGKYATLPFFYCARQSQLQRWKKRTFQDWMEEGNSHGSLRWLKNIENFLARDTTLEQDFQITSQWLLERIKEMYSRKLSSSRSTSKYINLIQLAFPKIIIYVTKKAISTYFQYKQYVLLLIFCKLQLRSLFHFIIGWGKIKTFVRKFPVESE